MEELVKLYERVIQRNNINLREIEHDVEPYLRDMISLDQMTRFYAFYGVTADHLLNLHFEHSALAGSYFLGNCSIINSILYKSDIRGDELKKKGQVYEHQQFKIPITKDERIVIEDSILIKTLVHNYSHDPETPEEFFIKDTVSTHYANIHGSPANGSFLGPFSTVDLTTMQDCVIGHFSYIQAGEISHLKIDPGTIWIRYPDKFNFLYRYPLLRLSEYIYFKAGSAPQGIFIDFVEDRKNAFQVVFDVVNYESPIPVPATASLDRYAVTKPTTEISDNVLVAQRAFLQNSFLGEGANAQENCFIINSCLEGYNVTAHGAKIIEADLGNKVFVGFNSFLKGRPDARLTIGHDSIIMPHTIIDIRKPLSIPAGQLVWGLVTEQQDLEVNSMPLVEMAKISSHCHKGNMLFEGSGASFVTSFQDRIQHILDANGAFFDGKENRGHAQLNQNISFNTIQPYPRGEFKGLYPTMRMMP